MTAIDTGERSEQESERCSEGPGIFVRGMRGWVTIRKHPLKLQSENATSMSFMLVALVL